MTPLHIISSNSFILKKRLAKYFSGIEKVNQNENFDLILSNEVELKELIAKLSDYA